MEKVKKRYWHMPSEKYEIGDQSYYDNHDYIYNAYTGLVDQDLQPIYEDDIIHVVEEDREGYYAVVKHNYNKSYSAFDTYPVRQPYFSLGLAWITSSFVKGLKVVGNIREEKYKKYRDLI
jgi:hypothetical protein